MPRFKLTLEYDGTGLAGWQRQENVPSVQQFLEQALEKFLGQKIITHVAGRTDAGVHATGQVAHFDTVKTYSERAVQRALNFYLQDRPLVVLEAKEVGENFHARFSATQRSYLYRILPRPVLTVLDANRVWSLREPLEVEAMQKAASLLIGKHDFTSFRASECQAKSPLKTIDSIKVEWVREEIHLTISAPSFLHHMVRNITGTLYLVGCGKWNWQKMEEILAAKSRSKAGPTAPPQGLYLTEVCYASIAR